MTQPSAPRTGQPRLIRIDFPRVYIKQERLAQTSIDAVQPGDRKPHGVQPEVSATRYGNVQPAEPVHGGRKLPHDAATIGDAMRESLRVWNAVAIMIDRIDARVVAEV